MKTAYFDCFSGASGDMILGALLDAGLELESLLSMLRRLPIEGWRLHRESTERGGIGASRAVVEVDEASEPRHLPDVTALISAADLPEPVRARSLSVFRRLAEAEAAVHRIPAEEVHFHEVGAVDAVIDIVGAVTGLWQMGIERVVCSPLHVGSGTVSCDHGILPVPAPATAELIRGFPSYAGDVEGELLTPTGAALLTTLAETFGPLPHMTVDAVGYGAGAAVRTLPNLLRLFVGETTETAAARTVAVLETDLDDMNPQIYGYVVEKWLADGALDVSMAPLYMKKNRPGTRLTVLCPAHRARHFMGEILRETSTIGVRWRTDMRIEAERRLETVTTAYGPVKIKVAVMDGRILNVSPEYEDCRRLADRNRVPLKSVMEAARRAAAEADFLP
ncbi:MAG: nickel pincer cofactor biosynthesis protein LarC [Desulfobacteraceae bacterium]|jgi:uncharacterized protein (TIGR00299 family) protein|nr:nickel pincer cofactor biosynthesis protein LarC [Desulfobacteraceae bacterium]